MSSVNPGFSTSPLSSYNLSLLQEFNQGGGQSNFETLRNRALSDMLSRNQIFGANRFMGSLVNNALLQNKSSIFRQNNTAQAKSLFDLLSNNRSTRTSSTSSSRSNRNTSRTVMTLVTKLLTSKSVNTADVIRSNPQLASVAFPTAQQAVQTNNSTPNGGNNTTSQSTSTSQTTGNTSQASNPTLTSNNPNSTQGNNTPNNTNPTNNNGGNANNNPNPALDPRREWTASMVGVHNNTQLGNFTYTAPENRVLFSTAQARVGEIKLSDTKNSLYMEGLMNNTDKITGGSQSDYMVLRGVANTYKEVNAGNGNNVIHVSGGGNTIEKITAGDGRDTLIIDGRNGDNYIKEVNLGGGDDYVIINPALDTTTASRTVINGGPGRDVVDFVGPQSNYTIERDPSGRIISVTRTGTEHTYELVNIEQVRFNATEPALPPAQPPAEPVHPDLVLPNPPADVTSIPVQEQSVQRQD